ncbi:MAG: hypothetical protein OEQ53_03490 [Saprospiraceae bacterium]|nr:hypothetical protein [Saprospiraceae bacterium]
MKAHQINKILIRHMMVSVPIMFMLSCVEPVNRFHLDLDAPPDTLSLFIPGVISTDQYVRDLTMSKSRDAQYFTIVSRKNTISAIAFCRLIGGHWTTPEIASFSGRFRDLEPYFHPDGSKLFFASNRPKVGREGDDIDIWYVEQQSDGGWGDPVNVGPPVNTDQNEFYPAVAANGNLYFTGAYDDGFGREDIYLSGYANGRYSDPMALDTTVTSEYYEFNAWIAPDENLILFSSFGRSDGMGGGDLYMSRRASDGSWSNSENLGPTFNSVDLDYCPLIDPSNDLFFMTSERSEILTNYQQPLTWTRFDSIMKSPLNGTGNIFWMRSNEIFK